VLFLAFTVDGLNSFAASLNQGWALYETTNLSRLATGIGAGIVLGAVLAPLFNQTAWASWIKASVMPDGKSLAKLLAAEVVVAWLLIAVRKYYATLQRFYPSWGR